MKEFKDLVTMIYLILKDQKLQMKSIKHQSKMVDFYSKNNKNIYLHKETKQFMKSLRERIYEIRNELGVKL